MKPDTKMKGNDLAERIEEVITSDGLRIEFRLIRKKVKNINLRVRPDREVVVSAPDYVPLKSIQSFVSAKASWIFKNMERYSQIQILNRERQYISGEIMQYLGREHSLEIRDCAGYEKAFLANGLIVLATSNESSPADREKMLLEWYFNQASEQFKRSLDRTYPIVASSGCPFPEIKIRKMKSRWGSCSRTKKKITLNLSLILMSERVIDYILLHELAHFMHHGHDHHFYQFLSGKMPDWPERREELKSFASSAKLF